MARQRDVIEERTLHRTDARRKRASQRAPANDPRLLEKRVARDYGDSRNEVVDADAQAIVLLGCRIRPGAELPGAAGRRAARAARAFHDSVAPLVVASGGKRWNGVTEAEALRRALTKAGVPSHQILLETRSHSTRENALFVAELLQKRRIQRIALVTCDFHMPRALLSFRAVGLSALGLPVLSPRGSVLRRARRVVTERIKSLYARIMWGWPT